MTQNKNMSLLCLNIITIDNIIQCLILTISRVDVSIVSTNMFGDIMKKESKSNKGTGHSFEDYFKRAVNPLLVLLLLSERPMYAYEMTHELEKRCDGKYSFSLLYPVIYRLSSQGFVREGSKAVSDDNRVRQYYEITPNGIAYLHQIEDVYDQLSEVIQQIRHNSGDDKV